MAAETLSGGETGGGRGGGAGGSIQMNLMPPGVPKVNLFSLFCIIRVASCGGHDSLPDSIFLYKI